MGPHGHGWAGRYQLCQCRSWCRPHFPCGKAHTGIRGLAHTGIRGLAHTGIRGLANTGIRGLAHTGIRGLAHTGIRGLAHTGIRDVDLTFGHAPEDIARLFRISGCFQHTTRTQTAWLPPHVTCIVASLLLTCEESASPCSCLLYTVGTTRYHIDMAGK